MTRKEKREVTQKRRMDIVRCVDRIFWEAVKDKGPDGNDSIQINAAIGVVAKYVDIMIKKQPRDQSLILSAAMKWQGVLMSVLEKHGVEKEAFRMALQEETKGRIEG